MFPIIGLVLANMAPCIWRWNCGAWCRTSFNRHGPGYLDQEGMSYTNQQASWTVNITNWNSSSAMVNGDCPCFTDTCSIYYCTQPRFQFYRVDFLSVCPPTPSPTGVPTRFPTGAPSDRPTTQSPTGAPTRFPTGAPTHSPTVTPTTHVPTGAPRSPTGAPTHAPTGVPTRTPTENTPTGTPTTGTPTTGTPTTGNPTTGNPTTGTPTTGTPTTGNLSGTLVASGSQNKRGDGVMIYLIVLVVVAVIIVVIVLIRRKKRQGQRWHNNAEHNPMFDAAPTFLMGFGGEKSNAIYERIDDVRAQHHIYAVPTDVPGPPAYDDPRLANPNLGRGRVAPSYDDPRIVGNYDDPRLVNPHSERGHSSPSYDDPRMVNPHSERGHMSPSYDDPRNVRNYDDPRSTWVKLITYDDPRADDDQFDGFDA